MMTLIWVMMSNMKMVMKKRKLILELNPIPPSHKKNIFIRRLSHFSADMRSQNNRGRGGNGGRGSSSSSPSNRGRGGGGRGGERAPPTGIKTVTAILLPPEFWEINSIRDLRFL